MRAPEQLSEPSEMRETNRTERANKGESTKPPERFLIKGAT